MKIKTLKPSAMLVAGNMNCRRFEYIIHSRALIACVSILPVIKASHLRGEIS